jgi:RNA polymerase sigma-70 factor (ECF subfamily)
VDALDYLAAELQSGPAARPQNLPDESLAAVHDIRRFTTSHIMYLGIPLADAEDAVEDAVCELYFRLLRGDAPRQPRAWARVVARRAAARYTERRHRERPTTHEDLAIFAGPAGDHSDITDYLAERDQVFDWIHSLPPNHQEVITLIMDGYSASEIAHHLGLPIGIVRVRLRAAREKLRGVFVAQMAADRQAERAERYTADQHTMARRSRSPVQRPRPIETSTAEESTDLRELADLPPRQQEVLRLSRRGYKPAQIARVLGLSPNTVRVNLFHARKRMRRNLELLDSEGSRLITGGSPERTQSMTDAIRHWN